MQAKTGRIIRPLPLKTLPVQSPSTSSTTDTQEQQQSVMDSSCQVLVSKSSVSQRQSNNSPFFVTGSLSSNLSSTSSTCSSSSSHHPDSLMTSSNSSSKPSVYSSSSHGVSSTHHPEPPPRPSKSHPNGSSSSNSASMINSQSAKTTANFLGPSIQEEQFPSSVNSHAMVSSSTPKSFLSQSQYSLSQHSSSSYFMEDDNWYSQLFVNRTPSATPVFSHHNHRHGSSSGNNRSTLISNNSSVHARKVKRSSTFNSDDLAVQTPSPSDSGIAELETILREKDAEITFLRETLEQNEQVSCLAFLKFPFCLKCVVASLIKSLRDSPVESFFCSPKTMAFLWWQEEIKHEKMNCF